MGSHAWQVNGACGECRLFVVQGGHGIDHGSFVRWEAGDCHGYEEE
jgi:hypothetical protein